MLSLSRLLLQRQGGKIPSPGSSLLNPRSGRSRLRQAMAAHEAGQQFFDQQALYADIGGSAESGKKHKIKRKSQHGSTSANKSKAQRKAYHIQRVGAEVAENAKYLTDAEWESVSLEDKHAFAKYMNTLLKERPTEATEQQRRRYFETTMVDPRDLDPNSTVEDSYERIKLGLPVQLKSPQRSLGVSQALYDSAEASLFDPANVHKLENAMTQVKQVFTDYVQQRRQGTSTEHARRQLANMTADLNVETQKHLANMFKYTEEKIRRAALDEREAQLKELSRLKDILASRRHTGSTDNAPSKHEDEESASGKVQMQQPPRHRRRRRRLSVAERKAKLTASISKAIGLDVNVIQCLLEELDAQERFMQFCEVFARLTVGAGFSHTSDDETLDAYTESLKKLYSMDANKLSTLEVAQYMAAKEDAQPVEWARRWYERALLVPLQQTPEYQRLQRIQEADKEALTLQHTLQEESRHSSEDIGAAAAAKDSSSPDVPSSGTAAEGERGVAPPDAGTAAALEISATAAHAKQDKVIRLVEKMFLRPDDPRLESLHEKRLRYLAYLQMERQIAQARENAALFSEVQYSPEAAECHELYQKLLARKAAVVKAAAATPSTEAPVGQHGGSEAPTVTDAAPANLFATDPEAAQLFEQIRDITNSVIARTLAAERADPSSFSSSASGATTAGRRPTEAARRAKRVASLLKGIQSSGADSAELRSALAERKEQVTRRLLGIVERDVRAEVEWLESMEEAERPPLLPVPSGASYISASDVAAWQQLREEDEKKAANPFTKKHRTFQPELFGQTWHIPDKPLLFWGTGTKAVQQALQHAAADANRKRRGEPLAPPYPCPENPWGWRLVKDILDD